MASLAAWTGCEQPSHRAAVENRERNLQRTVATLANMENERPANMQRMLATIQQQHAYDIERSNQNAVGLDQAIRAEFDRWAQQQPVYRKRFEELMQGNPANLERTLPYIIY
jgi:hypothetical protein